MDPTGRQGTWSTAAKIAIVVLAGLVQGVVPAALGLPGVLGAATTRAAGDDPTDRAQLHGQHAFARGPEQRA